MEPHSRLAPLQNGPFRLPPALLCLLRTCFARLPAPAQTQADTDISLLSAIKAFGRCLIVLVNPFAYHRDRTTTTFVGMIKLAVLCGLGTLWIGSQGNRKGKAVAAAGDPSRALDVDGRGKSCILVSRYRGITCFVISNTTTSKLFRPHTCLDPVPSFTYYA
jgi:hypothetical protein